MAPLNEPKLVTLQLAAFFSRYIFCLNILHLILARLNMRTKEYSNPFVIKSLVTFAEHSKHAFLRLASLIATCWTKYALRENGIMKQVLLSIVISHRTSKSQRRTAIALLFVLNWCICSTLIPHSIAAP